MVERSTKLSAALLLCTLSFLCLVVFSKISTYPHTSIVLGVTAIPAVLLLLSLFRRHCILVVGAAVTLLMIFNVLVQKFLRFFSVEKVVSVTFKEDPSASYELAFLLLAPLFITLLALFIELRHYRERWTQVHHVLLFVSLIVIFIYEQEQLRSQKPSAHYRAPAKKSDLAHVTLSISMSTFTAMSVILYEVNLKAMTTWVVLVSSVYWYWLLCMDPFLIFDGLESNLLNVTQRAFSSYAFGDRRHSELERHLNLSSRLISIFLSVVMAWKVQGRKLLFTSIVLPTAAFDLFRSIPYVSVNMEWYDALAVALSLLFMISITRDVIKVRDAWTNACTFCFVAVNILQFVGVDFLAFETVAAYLAWAVGLLVAVNAGLSRPSMNAVPLLCFGLYQLWVLWYDPWKQNVYLGFDDGIVPEREKDEQSFRLIVFWITSAMLLEVDHVYAAAAGAPLVVSGASAVIFRSGIISYALEKPWSDRNWIVPNIDGMPRFLPARSDDVYVPNCEDLLKVAAACLCVFIAVKKLHRFRDDLHFKALFIFYISAAFGSLLSGTGSTPIELEGWFVAFSLCAALNMAVKPNQFALFFVGFAYQMIVKQYGEDP